MRVFNNFKNFLLKKKNIHTMVDVLSIGMVIFGIIWIIVILIERK
jgi:uncharacterized membrane protein